MHVYTSVGTYYVRPNIFGEKKKKKKPGGQARDGHVVCEKSGSFSLNGKNGVDIWTFRAENMCIFT